MCHIWADLRLSPHLGVQHGSSRRSEEVVLFNGSSSDGRAMSFEEQYRALAAAGGGRFKSAWWVVETLAFGFNHAHRPLLVVAVCCSSIVRSGFSWKHVHLRIQVHINPYHSHSSHSTAIYSHPQPSTPTFSPHDTGLFSRASLAFGVHGAGFANVLWMSSGTTAIELMCSMDTVEAPGFAAFSFGSGTMSG